MGKCKCCCTPGPRGPPGNAQDVIWRPFYTGPQQKNLVRTPGADGWNEVVRLLSKSVGPRTLYLDPSDYVTQTPPPTNPFIVPAGTYDLANVTIKVDTRWSPIITLSAIPPPPPEIVLIVEDGAILNNLVTLMGPFFTEYRGTTVPCVTIDLASHASNVYLSLGAAVICTGSAPFWQFINPSGLEDEKGTIILDLGGLVLSATGTVPVIDNAIDAAETSVDIFIGDYSVLAPETLSGIATCGYIIFFNAPFAVTVSGNPIPFGLQIPFVKMTEQPSVLGAVALIDASLRAKTVSPGGTPFAYDASNGFKYGDIWTDGGDVYIFTSTGWVTVS